MAGSTTIPILNGLVARGALKNFKLETIEEEPGSGMREHDRLLLVLPSGEQIVIDTICSGVSENTSIIIDNASAPDSNPWQGDRTVPIDPRDPDGNPVLVSVQAKCDCRCHNIPREGFFHCFSPCKCGK